MKSPIVLISFLFISLLLMLPGHVFAIKLQLKDGRIISGAQALVDSVIDSGPPGEQKIRLISVVDDGLRRIFIHKYNIREVFPEGDGESPEIFKFHQHYAKIGTEVAELGGSAPVDEFDEYGRRIVELFSGGGSKLTVQSITEINPNYIRLQALSFIWDSRIQTNSIPRSILTPIILKQVDPSSLTDRTRLVRFYVQAQQYSEATEELDSIAKDFGEEADIVQYRRRLKQLAADQLFGEIKIRFDHGQYGIMKRHIDEFPTEGVSVEILQKVRQVQREYENIENRRAETLERLEILHDKVVAEELDPLTKSNKQVLKQVLEDVKRELSVATLDRFKMMHSYYERADRTDREKLAYGISGWLIGENAAESNLVLALSLARTRNLIRMYLLETDEMKRAEILKQIRAQEAGIPEYVAAIIGLMTPPEPTPKLAEKAPGYFELETQGIQPPTQPGFPVFKYKIQLPPEYDPNRRYPIVVTLNGNDSSPKRQIEWWAGEYVNGVRLGHSGRNGYIVLAPEWNPDRANYNYGPLPHAAVLYTLRDAMRRFSIDSDRVFISGNGAGGEAAWDIGLAHPDMWAGIIPICCVAGPTIRKYDDNAFYVPVYYIGGELETRKVVHNAATWDHYFTKQSNITNLTVTLFRGRGHEDYYEEIIRIFEFMNLHRRDFARKDFTATALRRFDNFFWSVELGDSLGNAPGILEPINIGKAGRGQTISVKIFPSGNVTIKTGVIKKDLAIYFTPEMVNFSQRYDIKLNTKPLGRRNAILEPDIAIILEDSRTRCDRQHPFWVKLVP